MIIKRDDGGNAPDTAKRLAQELIVSEHVDFLMGLVFSPNAKAVGDVSTSAKKPTFITNAASNGILEPNPYMARFSYTEGRTDDAARAVGAQEQHQERLLDRA